MFLSCCLRDVAKVSSNADQLIFVSCSSCFLSFVFIFLMFDSFLSPYTIVKYS